MAIIKQSYLPLQAQKKELTSTKFLSDGKSLLYLGWSVGRSVCLQNEIYLDETHCSKHLNEKCLFKLEFFISKMMKKLLNANYILVKI